MKRVLTWKKFTQGREVILYPVLRRHIPKRVSSLAPLAPELAALREQGHSILELRAFVYAKTGWKPGERAIYRQLAKVREDVP